MINRLFELSLLLNLTSISVYLQTLGLPSAPLSIFFVIINLLYLGHHWPTTSRLLAKRSIVEWVIYLAVWPAVSVILLVIANAELELVPFVKASLTLTSLVLASALYVSLRGWERFRKLAMIALVIVALGFVLQWIIPSLFQRYTASGGGEPELLGRAHGFFGGPNAAAQGIVMLTVVVLAALRETSNQAKILPVATMLILVVATGSRSGMVMSAAMAGLIGWQMRGSLRVGRRKLLPELGVGALAVAAVAMMVAAFAVLPWLGGRLQGGKYQVLGQRIVFWTEVGSTGDVLEEKSLATRLEAQVRYIGEIAKEPILGYGVSFYGRGLGTKTSHSLFLSQAFKHGVLYSLFLIYLLWRLFWTKSAVPQAAPLARVASNAVLVIVISGLAMAGVLMVRPITVAVGAILGAKVFPMRALRDPKPTLNGRLPREGGAA